MLQCEEIFIKEEEKEEGKIMNNNDKCTRRQSKQRARTGREENKSIIMMKERARQTKSENKQERIMWST